MEIRTVMENGTLVWMRKNEWEEMPLIVGIVVAPVEQDEKEPEDYYVTYGEFWYVRPTESLKPLTVEEKVLYMLENQLEGK